MDGGNRPLSERVSISMTMPLGLRLMAERYGNDRGLVSFSAAIVELLETHPAIAYQVAKLYNEASPQGKD